ncbi:MAG: hypothetical protein ACJ763_06120 [Bdellovibrionia bacterium]
MKKLGLIAALAIATQMQVIAPAMAGSGDRAGNGGDFDEMQFVTLAYQDLDVLRALNKQQVLPVNLAVYAQKLQTLRVKFVDKAELPDGPRSAVNYPAENTIEVDAKAWNKHSDKLARLELVLHEMLWICGVNDQAYAVSTPLFAQMKPLLERRSDQPSKTPVLLATYEMENPNQGMNEETAGQECARQKELYEDKYYFVYCIYYQRDRKHVVMEAFNDQTRLRLKKKGFEKEFAEDHWHTMPVTETESLYGLRVFGLGELDQLQWKVVASSMGLGGGLVDHTFERSIDALIACHERLAAEDRNSVKFSGAVCRSVQADNGSYFYQIVTKNPLVVGKE